MNGEHNGRILKATLPSEERLKSIKFIEELFKRGSSYFLHPFKIVYLADEKDNSVPPKILVSVPKKSFKRAVDRNLLKRRIKEAYRKNKSGIFSSPDIVMPTHLAIIYIGKDKLDFDTIEKKLILILNRLKST